MQISLIISHVLTMFCSVVHLCVFHVCVLPYITKDSCKCTMCLAVQSDVSVLLLVLVLSQINEDDDDA